MQSCDKLGYNNNNSLKAMKFTWCLGLGGKWFVTYNKEKIVGISGVHPWRNGVRALFRGAQLYSIPGGLSRNHMNCWMFKYHLPLVIDMYKDKNIYITTNMDNDASGKMLKLNKLYFVLEKSNLVLHQGITEFNKFAGEVQSTDLPKNFTYYAMGHLHDTEVKQFNHLNGPIAYPGSIELTTREGIKKTRI